MQLDSPQQIQEQLDLIQTQLGLLEKKHRTKIDPGIKAIWAKFVLESFDSYEQFLGQLIYSINHDKAGSYDMPSPGMLLERAKGNIDADASLEWSKVLKKAEGSDDLLDTSDLSERTRAAAESVGGIRKLAKGDPSKNSFEEKAFVKAYTSYTKKQVKAVLAPSVSSKLLKRGEE